MVYFIYPSRFQGHLNYFHSIVAKLCTTDGNDNHKKWNVIKEIIAKEDRSSIMQSEFIIDNDFTTNPVTIANSFNDFFVNVGKNLADNIESIIDPLKYILIMSTALRLLR